MTLVLYRRRAFTTKLEVRRAMWRAFDTAVRRKPLAGAADAGRYGNSIDFCLKSLARRGVWEKGLPAICVILPPAPSFLQEDSSDACVSIDALASAAGTRTGIRESRDTHPGSRCNRGHVWIVSNQRQPRAVQHLYRQRHE